MLYVNLIYFEEQLAVLDSWMGKQDFVYTSLKDLAIGWCRKTDSGREIQSSETLGTEDLEK